MQITVTIPDEIEAKAKSQGISPEAYVQSLIEQATASEPLSPRSRTAEQIAAFFTTMAEGSERLPSLPTVSFTRESFYEDRH
jgi:hypothetical protein